MRSRLLWLAGASAVTIAATATAAAAGPVASRLTAAAGPAAPGIAAPDGATLAAAAAPDPGRRRGHPGAARTPTAKVSLTEADNGRTITVAPGTEIDVALKPDSGERWSPPRSNNPQSVSRGGGRMGWRRHSGAGKQQETPDLGPGRGRRGDGSTQAVFFAHRSGNATLNSAERKGGFLAFLQRGSGPSKSWSVKVTVSGPAPAAPKPQPTPQPKPGTPGAGVPGLPGVPGIQQQAPPAAAARLVAPVTAAVQRLHVATPRL